MSASEDITNLFRKFGGEPEQYQELSRDHAAQESRARWPLLASVHLAGNALAPSVKDGIQPASGTPVPNLQGHAPLQASASPFAAQAGAVMSTGGQTGALESDSTMVHVGGTTRSASVGSVGNTLFKKRVPVRHAASSPRSSIRAVADFDMDSQDTHAASASSVTSALSASLASSRRRAEPVTMRASVSGRLVSTGVGGLGGQGDIRRGIQTNRLAARVSAAPSTALRFEPHVTAEDRARGVPPAADHVDYEDHEALASQMLNVSGTGTTTAASASAVARPATLGQALRLSGKNEQIRTRVDSVRAFPRAEKRTSELDPQLSTQPGKLPHNLSAVFSRLAGPAEQAVPEAETAVAPATGNSLFARLSRL